MNGSANELKWLEMALEGQVLGQNHRATCRKPPWQVAVGSKALVRHTLVAAMGCATSAPRKELRQLFPMRLGRGIQGVGSGFDLRYVVPLEEVLRMEVVRSYQELRRAGILRQRPGDLEGPRRLREMMGNA